MNIQSTVILIVILILVVLAARRVYKTFSLKGSGCACHDSADDKPAKKKPFKMPTKTPVCPKCAAKDNPPSKES